MFVRISHRLETTNESLMDVGGDMFVNLYASQEWGGGYIKVYFVVIS